MSIKKRGSPALHHSEDISPVLVFFSAFFVSFELQKPPPHKNNRSRVKEHHPGVQGLGLGLGVRVCRGGRRPPGYRPPHEIPAAAWSTWSGPGRSMQRPGPHEVVCTPDRPTHEVVCTPCSGLDLMRWSVLQTDHIMRWSVLHAAARTS